MASEASRVKEEAIERVGMDAPPAVSKASRRRKGMEEVVKWVAATRPTPMMMVLDWVLTLEGEKEENA